MREDSKSECEKLQQLIEQRFELSAYILSSQPFVQSFASMRGNIQQNMRHFRIAVCQEWCRKNGVLNLAFGHTQDDQIETFLLRKANKIRASGAMREVVPLMHTRLIRPLLGTRRQVLRDWLLSQNVEWLEDPSNRSPRYARNELRLALDAEKKTEKEKQSIIVACKKIIRENDTIDETLEYFISRYVTFYAEGYARIASRAFLALKVKPAQRLLSLLAHRVGGMHVRTNQILHTLPIWQKKLTDSTTSHTLSLGRTVLFAKVRKKQSTAEHDFFIVRAQLALSSISLWDGLHRGKLWDGRYRLLPPLATRCKKKHQLARITCQALARDGIEQLRTIAKNNASADSQYCESLASMIAKFEGLPARARAVCPSFWLKNQLLALPTLGIYKHSKLTTGATTATSWLSMQECAYLPRLRWESVQQQNLHRIAVTDFVI